MLADYGFYYARLSGTSGKFVDFTFLWLAFEGDAISAFRNSKVSGSTGSKNTRNVVRPDWIEIGVPLVTLLQTVFPRGCEVTEITDPYKFSCHVA